MGWVSYLEDIHKRTEELETAIEQIRSGQIPYVDGNRARVVDIARAIRSLVGELQATLRRLGPEDSQRVDEILGFKERITTLESENKWMSTKLKEAFEQISRLRKERDGERKKFQFVVTKFREGGIVEVRRYLMNIGL